MKHLLLILLLTFGLAFPASGEDIDELIQQTHQKRELFFATIEKCLSGYTGLTRYQCSAVTYEYFYDMMAMYDKYTAMLTGELPVETPRHNDNLNNELFERIGLTP